MHTKYNSVEDNAERIKNEHSSTEGDGVGVTQSHVSSVVKLQDLSFVLSGVFSLLQASVCVKKLNGVVPDFQVLNVVC